MFDGIKNGWALIKESIRIFNRYPKFIIPLLISWCIYAPIIIYLKFFFNESAFSDSQIYLVVFGIIFIFSLILSFSGTVLLELIQQLEAGEKLSILKALGSALKRDGVKILPLVLMWAIIWFCLLVLEAFFSRRRRDSNTSFSLENSARTLGGSSASSASMNFFEGLQKGVRMLMFLILPAIAWEDLNFFEAVQKGWNIFTSRFAEFATGYVLTTLATSVVFLPPAILFVIANRGDIIFPDWVWVLTIIYIAFAWSYSIYLEQMFVAELYLWQMKWEEKALEAQEMGQEIPIFKNIPPPTLLQGPSYIMAMEPPNKQ
jgi:hypothetical protein